MDLLGEIQRARMNDKKAKTVILAPDDYALLDKLSAKTNVNRSRLLGLAVRFMADEYERKAPAPRSPVTRDAFINEMGKALAEAADKAHKEDK